MKNEAKYGEGSSRFTRSVNLEQDTARQGALVGYIVTSGVRRALLRVALPSDDGILRRAITLTGPYGTGKSAFGVFCTQLLAPKWWPNHKAAWELIHAADVALADQITSTKWPLPSLLPVVVTGSREPLATAVIRALIRSFQVVSEDRCKNHERHLRRLLRQAEEGQSLSSRTICEALTNSLALADSGRRSFQGISLVLDELGKFLEYAAAHPTESDVYVLQAIAELAVRSNRPLLVLSVLHQDFSAYVDRLGARERSEWEKVRGRFEDFAFEEPADEILRLLASARAQAQDVPSKECAHSKRTTGQSKTQRQFGTLAKNAAKLGLAPSSIAKNEFVQILNTCRPLHPIVSVMLGPLFRKLAQNERSVFSFLDSVEPNGLRDFVSRTSGQSDELYRTDRMYDYIIASVGTGLYTHGLRKRWAEIDAVLTRLPQATDLDVFLIKTIGILGAIGQWRNLRASREVLCFAASGLATPSEIDARLEELRRLSALVYRSYNASYSLWEGSDIDLDELVTAATARSATACTVASLAEKHVQPRPLVARRHSFQTGTLRFFSVRFATPKSISEAASESYGDADGVVFVVLPEHSEEVQAALNTVSSEAWAAYPRLVFGVATDHSALAAALRNYALLQDVQQNTPALAGDATARLELRARIMATRQQLDKAVSEILNPSVAHNQHCRWFYRGKRLDVSTQRELNDRLSVICDRVFHKTPRIKNELINRRELSSAAAAARRNLIEAMITKGDQSELGITGTPPEKSMYLSLLAATGLHCRSRGKYGFHAPGKDSDQGIQAIWEAMHRCFVESDAAPTNVSELFELLQSPPFGVKAGLVPVLFCAASLASDTEVAIYEEGSFVPQLTIAMFERLLKAPSRFSLQRWTITGIRTKVFDRLAQLLLPKDESARRPASQILSVVRPLCRFANTLNEYSRNTSSPSPEARRIRDALLRATKPDQLLFSELPIACGLPPFRAKPSKDSESVDQFITKLKAGLDELRGTYERLLHDVGRALGQPFELSGDLKQVRKTLIQRGTHIQSFIADPRLKSFVGRLIDEALPDDAWVESVAALLTQRPPAVWKDEDRARLEVVLTSMARLFRHVEAIAFNAPNANVEDHAVRIGITTKHSAELEYVIRVSPTELPYMESVQKSILAALGDAALNGHAETTVAALISIAQQLLNK